MHSVIPTRPLPSEYDARLSVFLFNHQVFVPLSAIYAHLYPDYQVKQIGSSTWVGVHKVYLYVLYHQPGMFVHLWNARLAFVHRGERTSTATLDRKSVV